MPTNYAALWSRLVQGKQFHLKTTYDPNRRIPWRAIIQQGRREWSAYGNSEFSARRVCLDKMIQDGAVTYDRV